MNRRTFLAAVSAVPALAAGDILVDNTPRPVRKPKPLDAFVQVVYDIAKEYPGLQVVETEGLPLQRYDPYYGYEFRVVYPVGDRVFTSVAMLEDKTVYERRLDVWRQQVRDLFEVSEETQQRGGFA